jgi:uncharacterized protein (DUF427 family)
MVKVDGLVVAESSSAIHLYETPFKPRYYIPKTAVSDSK